VNPAGTVFDQACPREGERNASWNADVRVATSVEEGRAWTVEVALPLEDLGAHVGDGQTWRLNVTRARPARAGAPYREWSWAALPGTNFHAPDAFGALEGVRVPARADGVTR